MEEIRDKFDARIFLQRNQTKNKRRVCALTRVSTQHEQQTNALVNQNQWIVDEISRHSDWEFNIETDLYIDSGVSGTSTKKRVGFNEMVDKAKAGDYDLIVTREVCRFMRNAKLTLNLVDELEKCGVEVYFVNDGIWSFNKDDYFKLTIMATYAEQESRKVSERVFSGQATARANGIHFGNGNILGYDIIKGEKSYQTTYVINEEQAKIVRLIYDLALEGLGMKRIKNYLEAKGYKTSEGKSTWHLATIERVLRRKTYIGEYEYLQSVTVDPLTHERINQLDKSKRVCASGSFPAIIEPDLWYKVQDIIDSRINHDLLASGKERRMKGANTNKDIFCQKMRCGCGRRFKKDIGRRDGTATYRCYQLVDDGSQKAREERSKILEDDCCINGIIDWKLNLFTSKVFNYLQVNCEEIKEYLLAVLDKVYISDNNQGYALEDKLVLQRNLQKLQNKRERLVDALADGIITKEVYVNKNNEIEQSIQDVELQLKKFDKLDTDEKSKELALKAIREYIEESLSFGNKDTETIPEELISTYVNSIKACANNVFEFNIRINPNAEFDSPLVVPDEEYIPSVHSATKHINNDSAVLLKEFEVDYDTAKEYANKLKRKVVRVHWQIPAKIRIYLSV